MGFPAGSSLDLNARTLAEPLAHILGQPVVVENKVGAGGNIAADAVVRATDEHTLGLMINGNLTTARLLNPRLPFDPIKDLRPVSLLCTAPLVLVVPANSPFQSLNDLISEGARAGSRWSYGSPGVGTLGHLGMEWLQSLTGLAAVHVPYPGYAQVATAMIGGQIQLSFMPPGLAQAQVKAGKLRALAVSTRGRSTLVPDVPGMGESGLAGFDLEVWNALAAPIGMPEPRAQALGERVAELLRQKPVRDAFFAQGWQVAGTPPEGLKNRILADRKVFGPLIQKLKLAQR
ncbi:MAG: tripartite tricarboxylate transporter substrate binding protein [Rhodoferax sp.]